MTCPTAVTDMPTSLSPVGARLGIFRRQPHPCLLELARRDLPPPGQLLELLLRLGELAEQPATTHLVAEDLGVRQLGRAPGLGTLELGDPLLELGDLLLERADQLGASVAFLRLPALALLVLFLGQRRRRRR